VRSSWLQWTLLLKIVLTFFWALPLLLAPSPSARLLGIPDPRPVLFARLLGAAFAALLVGYCLALRDSLRGLDVTDTVRVGIVSNGLACLLLLAGRREWARWGALGRRFLWASAVATGAITLALLAFGVVWKE
jgi:hypothetical protein